MKREHKINKNNINRYYELNNDSSYIMVNNIGYCLKCGAELDELANEPFCDRECKREYYAEIRKDLNGFVGD